MYIYFAKTHRGTGIKVCIAEGEPSNIVDRAVFKTTTPEETLPQISAWLREREFDALGVASFGPVDLDKSSST